MPINTNLFVVGKRFRIDFGKGNLNNKLIHIRAIVDDSYIVYRTWFKRKKYWSYQIESIYYFEMLFKEGTLIESKK